MAVFGARFVTKLSPPTERRRRTADLHGPRRAPSAPRCSRRQSRATTGQPSTTQPPAPRPSRSANPAAAMQTAKARTAAAPCGRRRPRTSARPMPCGVAAERGGGPGLRSVPPARAWRSVSRCGTRLGRRDEIGGGRAENRVPPPRPPRPPWAPLPSKCTVPGGTLWTLRVQGGTRDGDNIGNPARASASLADQAKRLRPFDAPGWSPRSVPAGNPPALPPLRLWPPGASALVAV